MRYLLFFLILMGSCNPEENVEFYRQFERDGIKINCKINRIKIQNISEEERQVFGIKTDKRTIIYAEIEIINMRNDIAIVNLGDYFLFVNGKQSSKLYIDSWRDIILKDRALKPMEKLKRSVCWAFDGSLKKMDYEKVKLNLGHSAE